VMPIVVFIGRIDGLSMILCLDLRTLYTVFAIINRMEQCYLADYGVCGKSVLI